MLSKISLSVADVWRRLALPGEPAASCRCPFHPDRNASFSIHMDGQRWKCFSGCGSGDAVDLLAKATGLTNREAIRAALKLGGGGNLPTANVPPAQSAKAAHGRPTLPADLHPGSRAELETVATVRNLSIAGIELASSRGLLLFGRVCGTPCWIATDAARALAQARRMDGHPFPAFGLLAKRKAHTLKGSGQGLPLGIGEAANSPTVLMVEGGPDLLAAHHFIACEGRENDVAAIAMLGASNHVPEDALLFLAHKRVRLFPHADPGGRAAAVRWACQLERVGCGVDAFRFDGLRRADGGAVGDLNDMAMVNADDFEAERSELERIMPQ